MIHSKNGFLLFWLLIRAPPTVSILDHLSREYSQVHILHFPQSQQKLFVNCKASNCCELVLTLALHWFLLKMDFEFPWGSFLNSDPQNKIFFQTTTEWFFCQQSSLRPKWCFYLSYLHMSQFEMILRKVFTILLRILYYLFLWKTVTKQLHNQRKLKTEEQNTFIFLNSTTKNILYDNSTNYSQFSTDLTLAI